MTRTTATERTRRRAVVIAMTVAAAIGATAMSGFAADDRKVAYRVGEDEWRVIDPNDWPQYPNARPRILRGRQGATYNITYLDVVNTTGYGFDDPTDGATRRATFDSVVAYIDTIIGDSGTADIQVQMSESDASGFLAAAGPFFFNGPDGFQNGTAFTHLSTGADPSGAIPDMVVTVDFGYTWNSGLGAPAGGEFDLFSVLLHEVTHGLGILSLADADGGSKINENNPGVSGVFSVLDSYLERGGGAKVLYLAGGVINADAVDITSDDIVFTGPLTSGTYGSDPAIYAPNPYQSGSSISHWDLSASPTAVMVPSIAAGAEKRTYDSYEISALYDLGYAQPVPTTTTTSTTTTSTTVTTVSTTTTLASALSCDVAPASPCIVADGAKLLYSEKKVGKEKMKVQWQKFGSATTQADFGDPVSASTAVVTCIYNDSNALVSENLVNRGGAICDGRPCWKAKGTTGYGYKDKAGSADGVTKIGYKSGDIGKGKASAQGKNNASKGQNSLPTGVVGALGGQVAPTVQILTDNGLCIGATLSVTKDDGAQYQAQK